MTPRPANGPLWVCLALFALPLHSAQAGPLNLSLDRVLDISGLGFNSVGGAAFDSSTGNLWLSDSTGQPSATNLVVELDPVTGAVVQSFDASVVPGLSAGADALAIEPVSKDLYLFSSFGESVAGRVTQAGTLVQTLIDSGNAGAAAFTQSGDLFTLTQDTGLWQQIDPATGAVQSSGSLIGYSGRIAAADVHPVTGMLFAYGDATDELLEIDLNTGQVLSTTDMSPLLLAADFPTGFSFNADGTELYLGRGTGAGAGSVLVFDVSTSLVPEPAAVLYALMSGLAGLGLTVARKVTRRRKVLRV